jgi:nucleotide-binding universal stress UspA family protein
MTFRSILVPIDGSPGNEAVLATALLAAKRFHAHIDALHVRLDPRNAIPYLGEGMSGALVEEVLSTAEHQGAERSQRARELFAAFLKKNDIPIVDKAAPQTRVTASWREIVGREDEVVALQGRVSDLVVFGKPEREEDTPSEITLDAALLDTGRPLLMASAKPLESIGKTIAIFWKGSREAARAIGAGMPFLALAERVVIITVPESAASSLTADDLARRLDWHGIKTEAIVASAKTVSAGEALLAAAVGVKADLLLMGAYTHSRVRQMILGGVTSHVVAKAEIPVLMQH